MKKNLNKILIGLFVVVAIGAFVLLFRGKLIKPQASGGAYIALSPAFGTFQVDDTINLSMVMSTNNRRISDFRISNLNYPADILEFQSINPTQIAGVEFSIVRNSGRITIYAHIPFGFTGRETYTLRFRALAPKIGR